MIRINKPYICQTCSQELINYSINQNTKKIVFNCDICKKTFELTENEYLKFITSLNKTK